MRTTPLDPKLIVVMPERKAPDEETVRSIMTSMQEVGLLQPIVVQRRHTDQRAYLVSGFHRLQAAIRLRWDAIDACELPTIDGDDAKAAIGRMAEVAENLHRREIGQIERSELTAQWTELSAKKAETDAARAEDVSRQVGAKLSKRGRAEGRKPGGIKQAARELGMSEQAVRRSLKIAALSPAAKEAARKLDLDGNQKALLQAAKHTEPAAQVDALKRLSSKVSPSGKKGVSPGYKLLRDAWAKATEKDRAQLLAEECCGDAN